MPLRDLEIGQSLGLDRGDAVICVPVYGAYDLFAQCLLSVLQHTEPDVALVICDDASPDPKLRELLCHANHSAGGRWPHEVHYLRQPANVGFVENVNTAMSSTAPADIVLLNSDCLVYEGWLSGLRCAAYSESRVATATALTNAGTIVSVPHRNQPAPRLPDDVTPRAGGRAGAAFLAAPAPGYPHVRGALRVHPPERDRARRTVRPGLLAGLRGGS